MIFRTFFTSKNKKYLPLSVTNPRILSLHYSSFLLLL